MRLSMALIFGRVVTKYGESFKKKIEKNGIVFNVSFMMVDGLRNSKRSPFQVLRPQDYLKSRSLDYLH